MLDRCLVMTPLMETNVFEKTKACTGFEPCKVSENKHLKSLANAFSSNLIKHTIVAETLKHPVHQVGVVSSAFTLSFYT